MHGCSTSVVMGKKLRQTEDGQEYTLLVQVDANDLTQHDQDDVKMMDAKVTNNKTNHLPHDSMSQDHVMCERVFSHFLIL